MLLQKRMAYVWNLFLIRRILFKHVSFSSNECVDSSTAFSSIFIPSRSDLHELNDKEHLHKFSHVIWDGASTHQIDN